MANIHILASPVSDAGAYSGGSWVASLPLPNLITRQPTLVARSADAAAASTRFVIDLGAVRPVSLFALIASNLSAAATVRFRVSNATDGSSPVLDVTVRARPPDVAFGAMPWGGMPWDGRTGANDPNGQTTLYRHTDSVYGRYALVDIADANNPAGYVQIGRCMIGEAFVPRFNMGFGAAFGLVDESRQSRSIGGQLWSDKRPKRRRFTCAFPALSQGEAWGAVYDLQTKLGLTGNLLVVYDPADRPDIVLRRTLYGTLTALADLVTANPSIDAPFTWNLAVEELI